MEHGLPPTAVLLMSLLREVQQFLFRLEESGRFSLSPADKIIAAVSGGPDSLTLLHLLTQRGLHLAENVIVAHLDHKLRPSSAGEAAQICRLAADWGATCRMKAVDVSALAQAEGLSIEEAGRRERYRFFAEVAAGHDAALIFTGHHAGDQVETILMHMLRGSGSAGLRGILPLTPLAGHPERWVVRPLLETSREQIEDYCRRHHLQPLMDESNTDTTFFRNRLRHDLLPLLETYNPRIRERLQAMAAVTAADYEWLQHQTAAALTTLRRQSGSGWMRLDLEGWQRLPLALRRSTLRMAAAQLRPRLRDLGFETVEQARRVAEKGDVGTGATLPGEMTLSVGYSELTLHTPGAAVPLPSLPQLKRMAPTPLPMPGRLLLAGGWSLSCQPLSAVPQSQVEQNDDRWVAYLAVGEGDSLVVRPRLPGERFQPLGMNGRTKSVKAVMIDRKIPAQLRPRWPIIATSHLLWIGGHTLDERAMVRPDSERVVKVVLSQDSQAT